VLFLKVVVVRLQQSIALRIIFPNTTFEEELKRKRTNHFWLILFHLSGD